MQQQNVVPKNEEYDKDKLVEYLSSIKDIEHPALTSNTPYMMEISLGNTCDLKCMYCSHHYSTQWATERIKYGDITQEQYDREFPKAAPSFDAKFWEWFNRVGRFNLLRLGIIGGEPLIMPEFYEFVNKLISSIEPINRFRTEKMTFWIVTNLNTPPNYLEKLFNYLPKLTEVFNVEILVSMESIGPKAEYIRNGLNWKKFTNNLSMLLSRQDLTFDFGFIMSLNALNITSIQDFIKFTEDLYTKYQNSHSLESGDTVLVI
jgi:MoaA/NifB/PqqE/SkfB family radical SAM enzyme